MNDQVLIGYYIESSIHERNSYGKKRNGDLRKLLTDTFLISFLYYALALLHLLLDFHCLSFLNKTVSL